MNPKIVFPTLLAACLTASSLALAYPAQVINDLHLRAGPARDFPSVRTLYAGTRVEVLGCVSDYQWCDVDAEGLRGWVYSPYLEATFQNQPVIVAQQGNSLALPIITFVVGAYWASHYRDRYWYDRWHQWNHWNYRPRPPGWHPPRPPGVFPQPRPPIGVRPPPRPPAVTLPSRPSDGHPTPPSRPPVGVRPPPRPPAVTLPARPSDGQAAPPSRPPGNASPGGNGPRPPMARPQGERPALRGNN